MAIEKIKIRGARTHNLKNVSVDIPRNQLVVVTGVSGSGKSSLAFDTLYAEGQRRYAESVSSYARRFMDVLDRPDVDSIEGLSPSIAISQHTSTPTTRSTVATVTEIADYLRVLFAKAGVPYCPDHDVPLTKSGIHDMVDAALNLEKGARAMILAPVVRGAVADLDTVAAEMARRGFLRLRVDGEVCTVDALPASGRGTLHTIEVVVDRLKISPEAKTRLADSFETAAKLSGGRTMLLDMTDGSLQSFNLHYGCPQCDYTIEDLTPAMFSFNNPLGACPHCEGTGIVEQFDPDVVVKDSSLSIADGAVCGCSRRNLAKFAELRDLFSLMGLSVETPWKDLPEWARILVLYGGQKASLKGAPGGLDYKGVIPELDRSWARARSESSKIGMRAMRRSCVCRHCGGERYRREVACVYLGEGASRINIIGLMNMTLQQAAERLDSLALTEQARQIAAGPLDAVQKRIGFLCDVGLGYLTLSRQARTLSGGEAQRIRLAGQIGSALTGVLYVLDEPTIGLHQADCARLIATLKELVGNGNTVVAVEHDEEVIRAADFVVDMGPGAGELGGELVACGTPQQVMADSQSKTGAYLAGRRAVDAERRTLDNPLARTLRIVGARGHNLKGVTCDFPVGAISVVTGVSGSGKSTLVNDTLAVALRALYHNSQERPLAHDRIEGAQFFDKVIIVDQSPIGKTPRSNPATYTGLFGLIREVFAQTQAAKERGYDAARFSFNSKGGGRCEACEGDGQIKIEMGVLPAVYIVCSTCQGLRYNRETLEVKYRGKSIAEVLDMTVSEALEFFSAWPAIVRKLRTLEQVGLGYIRLGQSASTFSGGEAQRIKLAEELARPDTGRTVYILDEPTTGLHFEDVDLLLRALRQLTDLGNTVIVIEHNLDVIRLADWVVDIGPEAAEEGGRVLCEGTPEEVAACPQSRTAPYLREAMAGIGR
jgi:excinuclease ABC subunit A